LLITKSQQADVLRSLRMEKQAMTTNQAQTPTGQQDRQLTADELDQIAGGWSVSALSQMGGGGITGGQEGNLYVGETISGRRIQK
jgi:hypothetical protein